MVIPVVSLQLNLPPKKSTSPPPATVNLYPGVAVPTPTLLVIASTTRVLVFTIKLLPATPSTIKAFTVAVPFTSNVVAGEAVPIPSLLLVSSQNRLALS